MARRNNAALRDASADPATGAGFIHRLSVVEELEALFAHLGELEPVDEADDFAETAVHVRLLRPDLAHAEGRALPVIVVGAFRVRHVELVRYARLDGPQHAAFALARVILGEQQLEPEHADHHGPARRASGGALGRLHALARGGCEPAGHLLHLVGLDHVARLHVLVALERHAALVAARHLAHVLFEALEARDPAVVHDHVVAQEACLGAAQDLAIGYEAARHLADARDG